MEIVTEPARQPTGLFGLFIRYVLRKTSAEIAAAMEQDNAYFQLAERLGLQIDPGDLIGLGSCGFSLLDHGHSGRVIAILHGADDDAGAGRIRCAFEYRYKTGSGDLEKTHTFIGATLNISAMVPRLQIQRKGFDENLLGARGLRDVALESGEFNTAFRVAATDQKSAFAVLDGSLQEWLLARVNDPWLHIEKLGENVLVVHNGGDINVIPGLLEFTQQLRDLIPEVVSAMYPTSVASASAATPSTTPEPGAPE